MIIEIDKNSGFCFGVVNAITKVEEELKEDQIYCVGDIVHNNVEVDRLEKKGLITINHEDLYKLKDTKVAFRAHGEPPSSYEISKQNNLHIVDTTCPVVLRLQYMIKNAYKKIGQEAGRVVIFGKRGHAEVIGLVGQTDGNAIVMESIDDIDKIDFSHKVELFSQTTKSLQEFKKISQLMKEKGGENVTVHDTICRKVANRIPELEQFAKEHEVILFVSDKKSSNGNQLYKTCKNINSLSYFLSGANEIPYELLENVNSIGISGATSTPRWLMEIIKQKVFEYINK